MPLYDILNEFQKGSSHMVSVVKLKGKSKKAPSVLEEDKSDDNTVTGGNPNVNNHLLTAKGEKADCIIIDIDKATVSAVSPPTSGDAVTNGLPESSDDIEDVEVIGIITLEDVFEELLQVIFWVLLV
ncbi:hypothetical protein RND71_009984 [Anisodus tanguticus]|uniref:Uncharacterized protein n=1 Tax=Anisodus tanguticus TaxID=243964 RepID=A0AAE1VRS0_9SOLA|nr:hypothetical protein RND71_009984 [Anisodus tanguticus]